MALFNSPALHTPLLKVPILITGGIFTYMATGVPAMSHAPLKRKIVADDFMTRTSTLQVAIAKATMGVFCSLAAAESAAIFAQTFPEHPISQTVLAVLTPTGPLSLRATPAFVAGTVLTIVGSVFRTWSFRTLGEFFTGEVTLRNDHRLVTTGPYAIVRHPSYTGSAAVLVGNTVALLLSGGSFVVQMGIGGSSGHGVWWSPYVHTAAWVLASYRILTTLWILPCRAVKEDEILREEFGEEWAAYARRTPYRILPFVW